MKPTEEAAWNLVSNLDDMTANEKVTYLTRLLEFLPVEQFAIVSTYVHRIPSILKMRSTDENTNRFLLEQKEG